LQIPIVGSHVRSDTTITISSATDENSGMTVPSFAGISRNCGETNVRTGGEKWPKIDGNYGMIGGSCSRMRRGFNIIDIPGSRIV